MCIVYVARKVNVDVNVRLLDWRSFMELAAVELE
jgi:hypothetical protein